MEHYTVEVAYDGEEALEKAEINNYDLIIMDIMLPKWTASK
jgi:DNA-binding response OmpR family regulator